VRQQLAGVEEKRNHLVDVDRAARTRRRKVRGPEVGVAGRRIGSR
jgi:hypothetical protein